MYRDERRDFAREFVLDREIIIYKFLEAILAIKLKSRFFQKICCIAFFTLLNDSLKILHKDTPPLDNQHCLGCRGECRFFFSRFLLVPGTHEGGLRALTSLSLKFCSPGNE